MGLPTIETLLPGIISRCTEFVYDKAHTVWLTGDCGPDALAEAMAWADQVLCSADYVAGTYDGMLAAGECQPNGPSTIGGLYNAARRLKLPSVAVQYYGEDSATLAAVWAFIEGHVGRQAVVMETANGQALNDYLTGKGENASHLQYHYILLVGYHPGGRSSRAGRVLPAGFWAADGDNFDQGDVLQFYPTPVLQASKPCAALSFANRAAPQGSPILDTGYYGLVTTNDPQVWHCPSTNCDLGHGFLEHYKALQGGFNTNATEILGLPISNEYPWGGVIRQDFERGYLLYDGHQQNPWMVCHGTAGRDLRAAASTIASDSHTISSLQATLADDVKQIADLDAQVASLGNQVHTLEARVAALEAQEQMPAGLRQALATLDAAAKTILEAPQLPSGSWSPSMLLSAQSAATQQAMLAALSSGYVAVAAAIESVLAAVPPLPPTPAPAADAAPAPAPAPAAAPAAAPAS